ncbi:MAG TPA: hypothetical protein VGC86_06940 [Afipia sp.]
MSINSKLAFVAAMAGLLTFGASLPANALSMSECSAKYKSAKADGSLGTQKWNDFRKAQCGEEAAATPAAAPAAPAPAPAAKPAAAPKTAAAPAASGSAVFPSAIAPKYASETAGKGRMHTCVDQYNANKASGGNGGLKWIEKGGGYYSECNKRLKGA